MSEAKFTPGPWIFRKCSNYGISISTKDGESIIGAMECQNTAFLEIYDDDANLISAAPDLYDALQRMVNVLAELNTDVQDSCVFADARAALAKARGES